MLPLSAGGGVLLRSHSEYLSDVIMLANKVTGFSFLGLEESSLVDFTQLSLGPSSLFLNGRGGQWMQKKPLLKMIPVKGSLTFRVSKHGKTDRKSVV